MLNDRKTRALLIAILVLVILASLVLSISLTGLQLRGGIESIGTIEDETSSISELPGKAAHPLSLNFLQAVAAIVFLVLVIFLSIRVVKILVQHSTQWRGLWKIIVALVGVALIMVFLGNLTPVGIYDPLQDEVYLTPTPSIPIQNIEVGETPNGLRWLVLAVLLAGLTLLANYGLRRTKNTRPGDKIVHNAEDALDSILRGDDFRNVILRCYFEMSRVIQEENGVERDSTMTVREFEDELGTRGFDLEPIHKLGMLFEKARYSDQPITDLEEEEGLACLQKIARRSRKEGAR
jgi:hypothetical protein